MPAIATICTDKLKHAWQCSVRILVVQMAASLFSPNLLPLPLVRIVSTPLLLLPLVLGVDFRTLWIEQYRP